MIDIFLLMEYNKQDIDIMLPEEKHRTCDAPQRGVCGKQDRLVFGGSIGNCPEVLPCGKRN